MKREVADPITYRRRQIDAAQKLVLTISVAFEPIEKWSSERRRYLHG